MDPTPGQSLFGQLDPAIATALLNKPVVDGGYDWGKRGFPPQNPGPGQPGHGFVPGQPNPRQPIVAPHNPVPQTNPPSLKQMRAMMTQLHMQQMMNRLQKHANIHAGG